MATRLRPAVARALAAFVLAAPVALSCGQSDPRAATARSAQEGRTQRAIETARIGDGERTEYSFGAITGLAIDEAGHLYVADAQARLITVFDPRGALLATFGRRGNGPGEFQHPTSLGIAADGDLWVSDMERVQRFRPTRTGGPATQYAAVVGSVTYHDWTSTRPGTIDRDGYFHVPRSFTRTSTGRPEVVQTIVRLAANGKSVDTLAVPSYENTPALSASYMVSARSGRMLHGLNHVPFAAVPVWTSSPAGTIISGNARRYELVETDAAGKVLRRFSRPFIPVTIDRAERRDSLRALGARFDSIAVPLSQVQGMPDDVRDQRLPTHYPPYRELSVARDGALWVRRWTTRTERGTSKYDVFSPEARFLGTVVLPAELTGAPAIVIARDWIAGVSVDPETGLQSVVRFEYAVFSAPAFSPRPRGSP